MRLSKSRRLLSAVRIPSLKRTILLLTAVAVIAVLALATPAGWQRSESAAAASGGPEMRMEIIAGSGGFCNGNDCYAEAGAAFTLGIDVVTAPAAGYSAVQTHIDFRDYDPTATEDGTIPNTCGDGIDNGGYDGADMLDTDCLSPALVYLPRANAGDEFVDDNSNPPAPITAAFRSNVLIGVVSHAGLTALIPPLPTSNFVGRLLELDMSCPATPVTTSIDLLSYNDPIAGTGGAVFVDPDLETLVIPKVNSITVNCVSPQPFPGDTDGDGCADAREEGSNPALGGDRDFLNPWDFYDTNGDGVIDLLFDILGVIEHQGTAPGPPYDVNYDRGPWQGVNTWNDTLPPDGVIDEPIDIDGVFAQYGHNCT